MPRNSASKKPARTWRDPESIGRQNELEILRVLKGMKLQTWWSRSEAISFVQLTLKCALKEAIRRQNQRVNADHLYWADTEQLAINALAPLRDLISHMSPGGLKYLRNIDGYGRFKARMIMQKPDGTSMDEARSNAELNLLILAAKSIATIQTTAVNFRTDIPKTKGAEIEHDKHGFVYRLAEGWIYLTGKLPGEGKERNPFLRFVEAAAADAGVKETGFYSGLQAAIAHLTDLESRDQDRPPNIKNYQSITGIREFGPFWASSHGGNK